MGKLQFDFAIIASHDDKTAAVVPGHAVCGMSSTVETGHFANHFYVPYFYYSIGITTHKLISLFLGWWFKVVINRYTEMLNANELTALLCPLKVWTHKLDLMSHKEMLLSAEPVIK